MYFVIYCYLLQGLAWFGSNVAVVEPIQTPSVCQLKCALVSDCDFWDWSSHNAEDPRECWLKKAVKCKPQYSVKWGFVTGPVSTLN